MTIGATPCGPDRCGLWGLWREGRNAAEAGGHISQKATLCVCPPASGASPPKEPHVASFPPGSSCSPQPQSRAHRIHTPQTTPPQPPRPSPRVSGPLPTWGSPVSPRNVPAAAHDPAPGRLPPLAPAPSSSEHQQTEPTRAQTQCYPVPADLCLAVPFAWNPGLASSPGARTSLSRISRIFPVLPQAGLGALLWGPPPPPQPYSPHTGKLIHQLPTRPGALLLAPPVCGWRSVVEGFRVPV